MPSPFPGMDPYLEDPAYWRSVHAGLIFCAFQALNALLPAGYMATIDERLYVLLTSNVMYPDIALLHRKPDQVRERGTAALVAERDEPVTLTIYPEKIEERYIQIFTTAKPRKLVTVIEVLNPANKAAGSKGRDEYLRKQAELIQSDVNLLEIDLLRGGAHTIAAPSKPLSEHGRWDYLACLHRPSARYTYTCWLIQLRHALPHLTVPLLAGSPDVILDLQEVLDRAYDAGPYATAVDYTVHAIPPLSGDDAAWADSLIREKGMRA